jgi:hypothetical protein
MPPPLLLLLLLLCLVCCRPTLLPLPLPPPPPLLLLLLLVLLSLLPTQVVLTPALIASASQVLPVCEHAAPSAAAVGSLLLCLTGPA